MRLFFCCFHLNLNWTWSSHFPSQIEGDRSWIEETEMTLVPLDEKFQSVLDSAAPYFLTLECPCWMTNWNGIRLLFRSRELLDKVTSTWSSTALDASSDRSMLRLVTTSLLILLRLSIVRPSVGALSPSLLIWLDPKLRPLLTLTNRLMLGSAMVLGDCCWCWLGGSAVDGLNNGIGVDNKAGPMAAARPSGRLVE